MLRLKLICSLIFVASFAMLIQGTMGSRESSDYDCDLNMHLRHGQHFELDAFPPPPNPYMYMGQRYETARECTLVFRAQGNCVLKFRTMDYEMGDPDCRKQYLLMGDEYSERRVCGYKRPPARLVSDGRLLFLTHFQRGNAGDFYHWPNTASSYIGGVVSCARPKRYEHAMYYYDYDNDTTPCEPPQIQFLLGPAHTSPCGADVGSTAGPCNLNATVNADGVPTTGSAHCNASPAEVCAVTPFFFMAFQPCNATCAQPLPPITDLPAGKNCTVLDAAACPKNKPNCNVNFSLDFGGNANAGEPFACEFARAPPNSTCTFRVAFCLSVT